MKLFIIHSFIVEAGQAVISRRGEINTGGEEVDGAGGRLAERREENYGLTSF